MNELKKLGVELAFFIAGVAGAFVSLHNAEGQTNIKKTLFHISSGGLTAMYLTPFFASYVRLNTSATLFASFVIGYLGYKVIDLTAKWLIRKFKKQ